MEFRIADTFTDSLARLSGDEQKAVKTTAFDLQMNHANPGMSFHKLDKAKDKKFWSVRVSGDIRLIVHKNEASILLCYVDHHDKAYDWAERRKLEIHPKTGAAQLVEIRETVQEIFVPVYVQQEVQFNKISPKLFATISDDILLSYGVPEEWLKDVKEATEETLFSIVEHLPAEASEALLELATGGTPFITKFVTKVEDPFKHPDAQRRFRTMNNMEELERALDFPWDKWAVFLHPAQRQWVEKSYTGPARVSGSAGTGKTIVALHRAVFLAKSNPDTRVLLTTFSTILANSLKIKLRRLISNQPRLGEQIDVYSINDLGIRLYKANIAIPNIITKAKVVEIVKKALLGIEGHKFTFAFLVAEWEQVVDTWQLKTWEEYRDVKRLGRKTRLPEQQRAVIWSIFEKVNQQISEDNLLTYASIFCKLATHIDKTNKPPYDFAIVDEAQDISVCHLRFLATIGKDNPNALFFAGDLGQRIFQQAFSWMAVGVDIRGRSRTLNVNYRTSHQIRQQADRLLAPKVSDADGNVEERGNTVSVFNGVEPGIKTFESEHEEISFVGSWITTQIKEGVAPQEIGVFVRSSNEIGRAVAAVNGSKVSFTVLDESVDITHGSVAISTMHFAKGLEFRSVAVMACDDEVIPLQERIESVTENSDLEEVYNTERHLLYVACTRARDCLLITSVNPPSEFLEDLKAASN
jgi:superfamily I DNA/RNA helicase/mRNA-degrading endonuclease RelE of RelBE toxin-antitoxin system